jgi:hypothetical protein
MSLKIENSRRVAKSRPVCMDLKARSPLGEFFRAKRKTNLGNVIGQRKHSPRKSWISSYFFTVRASKFA